jgi:hypothetical protein
LCSRRREALRKERVTATLACAPGVFGVPVRAGLKGEAVSPAGGNAVSELGTLAGVQDGHWFRAESAFGPGYWLRRCEGFRALIHDREAGEVDAILEIDGVLEGLSIRFADGLVQVETTHIVDIDPIARVVVLDTW